MTFRANDDAVGGAPEGTTVAVVTGVGFGGPAICVAAQRFMANDLEQRGFLLAEGGFDRVGQDPVRGFDDQAPAVLAEYCARKAEISDESPRRVHTSNLCVRGEY